MTKYIVLDKLGNKYKAGDVLSVPADIKQKDADLLLIKGRIVEQKSKPKKSTKAKAD